MKYLKIRNWDKWQSYRKDRGRPPWIKVYQNLLRDYEWIALSDAERGQLMAIWLLAIDKSGQIPNDATLVQKLTHMTKRPNLEFFINHGFLEDDNHVVTTRLPGGNHVVAPDTDTETETETPLGRRQASAGGPGNGSNFEKFWAVYPRKEKRKQAYDLWKRMKIDQHADVLIQDIKDRLQYDEKWIREGGRFIPQATTYLNGHRWEDGYEAASSK